MNFNGFDKNDFNTFKIDGLDDRMEAIQQRIQPKFQAIGDAVSDDLSKMVGSDMFLHIARHARRTVNPPRDTWSAYCHNKRGYKKHPHFQIGLWDDNLFIWLAFIYELPNKSLLAERFLENIEDIKATVPGNYNISLDHMKNESYQVKDIDLNESLARFKNVKKGEFLIGRNFAPNDPILQDGQAFLNEVKKTFETLSPLYKIAMK
ncbi:YktB family protein [Aquibacillus saliphilus]|uniref:YktB family protein n=1 Tax=Aquibacillus saliphilus TaxID=1909422 RepID=UPI001CF06796|nr:DUF1054 domain-containing protein [Aquibacillus saliphilus]